jgi:hypothetical protein
MFKMTDNFLRNIEEKWTMCSDERFLQVKKKILDETKWKKAEGSSLTHKPNYFIREPIDYVGTYSDLPDIVKRINEQNTESILTCETNYSYGFWSETVYILKLYKKTDYNKS